MEFQYRAADGAPPPLQLYPMPPPFSFAPLPPPPHYHGYFPPPPDPASAPPPPSSDHGYYASHAFPARMLDYELWREELSTGHEPLLPSRLPRDPFLDREYERERIREEIVREEVRRRILEEEVRWELEMERYYSLRPSLGYHGTWSGVPFEQPRYSNGCYATSTRGQFSRKCFEERRKVREIPHRIMEINEEELMSNQPLPKDKVEPCNRKEIEKKKDGQEVQKEENGNKVEQLDVREIACKIVEINKEEISQTQALPKDKVEPPPNRDDIEKKGELRRKQVLPKDKIEPPNRDKIVQKEDGCNIQKQENGNKVANQIALSSHASKELLEKEAEAFRLKRKADSIAALASPTTTSNITDKAGPKRVKKQKIHKKEFNCAICRITLQSEACWLGHLNGKKHRKKLIHSGPIAETNGKKKLEMDKKSMPDLELKAVKVEMDKEDTPATEPLREGLKTDEKIIRKMQVGSEVHEVVERDNRLWCERCRYNCTTTVMMTIHLVSEKHKANCQKQ